MSEPQNITPGGGDSPLKRKRRPHEVTYPCEDCGEIVTRIRKSNDSRVCLTCGISRGIQAAREMHARSGPAYDRFLEVRHPARPGSDRKG